ncbi:hypothetical protein LO771_13180 [Streptacidiphilus sp. ASG 303]|uniref:hypothetical protein n=1 Tax=Streptacidiphilus sp. ASG 303 TaxID=2896847 RepID=UPI001E4267ED|nr:hypothetical protein [Streptacidiphilus sp. ASG 303]MCD0483328.1 hypothetical protein [Streptacidiphilus sp. ASG 303]
MPQSVPRAGGALLPPAVVDGLRAAVRRVPEAAEALPFDTVAVPLRHGLEAADILRLRGVCGAVLSDSGGTRLLFLVPPGTSERWHLAGSSCTPGAAAAPGAGWLVGTLGAGAALRATDPWVLRAVLCEAAGTLMAGGFGPY